MDPVPVSVDYVLPENLARSDNSELPEETPVPGADALAGTQCEIYFIIDIVAETGRAY